MCNDPTAKLCLDNIPYSRRKLIEDMTKYDPKERPTASQVLRKVEEITNSWHSLLASF